MATGKVAVLTQNKREIMRRNYRKSPIVLKNAKKEQYIDFFTNKTVRHSVIFIKIKKNKMMHEPDEFEKEVIEAYKVLESYATYLTKNNGQADDLLQDTLLRILTKFDKYEDQGCFNAWAKCIMKNIFVSRLTSNERHRQTFVDGYNYISDDSCHPIVAENDSKYSKDEIYKAIDLLSPRYSKMITMQLAGYKYEEIAESMNISVGCVKSTMFTARGQLKKLLK